ncbi:MAG: PhnD/SsuA/transferrin family substrate-binding protein [Sphingobium sp.]
MNIKGLNLFNTPWRMGRQFILSALLLTMAACGSGKADQKAVLNIGDQAKVLQLPMTLSGEDKGTEGTLRWTTFTNGPNMNAAFLADAIDVGWMGDTPALLASAAQADVVVIAGHGHEANSFYQIVAAPDAGIRTLADLRGKRVAFTKGTDVQGYLMRALKTAGLKLTDLKPIDLPIQSLGSALKSGDADAAILSGPILTGYLLDRPKAVLIAAPIRSYSVLVASRKTLEDPVKRPLLEDFVARQARAWKWAEIHEDQWREALFGALFRQSADAVKLLKARHANLILVGPVDEDLQRNFKEQAVLLKEADVIPDDRVADRLFDPAVIAKFNAIMAAATAR